MNSMTGYGKCTVSSDTRQLTVELKSVNHRFLDISTKIPRAFIAFEDVIRQTISAGLNRGHVDVFITYTLQGDSDKVVTVDTKLAEGYLNAANTLLQTFPGLAGTMDVKSLMREPDVLSITQMEEDEQVIRQMLTQALQGAVANLNQMRSVEGEKLKADILAKIAYFESLLDQVKSYAPMVNEQYREKLRQRVTEALGEVQLDEAKLANELCFYADKSCIDEEITRLTSHIAHAREIFASSGPVGRKLDFLIQEFNRETNTICSKSGLIELTDVALSMKNEIEKIREQIQNLE